MSEYYQSTIEICWSKTVLLPTVSQGISLKPSSQSSTKSWPECGLLLNIYELIAHTVVQGDQHCMDLL